MGKALLNYSKKFVVPLECILGALETVWVSAQWRIESWLKKEIADCGFV